MAEELNLLKAEAVTQIAADLSAVTADDRRQTEINRAATSGDVISSGVNAARAESAADAALLDGPTYPTEALGRAAVADNGTFLVEGSGDVAAYGYRRINASTSMQIASYPSSSYVDEVARRIASEDAEDDLEVSIDNAGEIYRRTDKNGHLYLPDLKGSVQDGLNGVSTAVRNDDSGMVESDIFSLADKDGKVVLRVTENSDLHLAGGLNALGGIAGDRTDTGVAIAETHTFHNNFSAETGGALAALSLSGITPIAPPPLTLLPGATSITANLVNAFTVAQPAKTVIDTPYYLDDEVVHPHVIEFPNGMRGYRYWMVITPYRAGSALFENPCVYGTNDFLTFDLLPDMPQPLAEFGPAPNFNSDCGFAYNPNTGELIVFWRYTYDHAETELFYRTTRDGINWSDQRTLYPRTPISTAANLSPSLLYNTGDGYWYLYAQQAGSSYPPTNQVRNLTVVKSRNLDGPWGAPVTIATTDEARPWHQEVCCIGDKVFCLLNNTFTGNLFLGVSEDWVTFETGTTPILTGNDASYKGSFIPVFDGDQMALRLVWTSAGSHPTNTDLNFDLYTAQTNFVSIYGA
ncbi:hypothetical protein [Sulfitobacter pontiacus]|uniref:hypothetical protein n=1 Tax=Sulfitobacter pontiacus TaxID=60137 RepID=UPI0015E054E3|nr:hypothetical protein [Sulfitobacter pontiacus]QLL42432.1 hypothetical protein G6548_07800 [Sulfitobacter pontiacus]